MTPLEAGIAAINEATPNTADEKQLLIAAKCRALLAGYLERWKDSPLAFTSVEETVESELWNPETGRRSRTFRLAGKIDAKGFQGTSRILMDHKTCSEDLSPESPYWRQLVVEGQPTHYMLLEHLNGRKIDQAIWDVIRKPGIKPSALTKKDTNETLASGYYFGREISDASLRSLRNDGRETLEMYEARLAWDCTNERPQYYFQRRDVVRLDADILEWAKRVWRIGQRIIECRRENSWIPNAGACMNFKRPCKFLGICSGMDSPDSDKWQRKSQVHNELTLDGDGRDVLTNSRMKCLLTCEYKHYLEYELGIERVDEEEAEALYFGSLLHLALETAIGATISVDQEKDDTNADAAPVNNDASNTAEEV